MRLILPRSRGTKDSIVFRCKKRKTNNVTYYTLPVQYIYIILYVIIYMTHKYIIFVKYNIICDDDIVDRYFTRLLHNNIILSSHTLFWILYIQCDSPSILTPVFLMHLYLFEFFIPTNLAVSCDDIETSFFE